MRTAFSAFATAIVERLFFLLTTVLFFGMSLIQMPIPPQGSTAVSPP